VTVDGAVQLIGASRAMLELKEEIVRVAHSDAKVLITGESGTGKEVVARAIALHPASRRADTFIPVNCAGIAETLLESELFGHVRGSFTGAYRDKPGKLEMASGGTLFLDEIGEMTLRMQGLLLRFLETGEIQKVGAERVSVAGNVRIISATNRDLAYLVARTRFREDLYYRLNVIHITIPPLRERKEDIPLLIDHFMTRFARPNGNGGNHGSPVKALSADARAALCRFSWPGNVRQLENVIERVVVTGREEVVQVEALPQEVLRQPTHGRLQGQERRHTVAEDLFKKMLEERVSFWQAVYPLYMGREIAKGQLRDVIHKGLAEARGNYRTMLRLFNMESSDYKRFLSFLRKHDCQLPFKEYR
jgi:transcriptional regulator with PAS, ATPase and Fis domain